MGTSVQLAPLRLPISSTSLSSRIRSWIRVSGLVFPEIQRSSAIGYQLSLGLNWKDFSLIRLLLSLAAWLSVLVRSVPREWLWAAREDAIDSWTGSTCCAVKPEKARRGTEGPGTQHPPPVCACASDESTPISINQREKSTSLLLPRQHKREEWGSPRPAPLWPSAIRGCCWLFFEFFLLRTRGRERERERERERDGDRDRGRDRDRETERQRQRETERSRDRDRRRQTDKQTDRQTDRKTDRQTGRETGRQRQREGGERWTGRERVRERGGGREKGGGEGGRDWERRLGGFGRSKCNRVKEARPLVKKGEVVHKVSVMCSFAVSARIFYELLGVLSATWLLQESGFGLW